MRAKRMTVDCNLILQIIRKSFNIDLPRDVRVIRAKESDRIGCVEWVLESDEYADLSPGEIIPEVSPEINSSENLERTDNQVLFWQVQKLGLSMRASNAIYKAFSPNFSNIRVHHLINLSPQQILAHRNVGIGTLNEIRNRLSEYGLALRNDSGTNDV